MRYIYDKLGMLQGRENEISLRKWSGGTAQLRTLERTLVVAAYVVVSFPSAIF